MRIDEIHIKNFKGFEDEHFKFNPHFTVIIGENAKGKTALLDALAIALGCYLSGIDLGEPKLIRSFKRNEIRTQTFDNEPRYQLPVEIGATAVFGESNSEKKLYWQKILANVNRRLNITTLSYKSVKKRAEEDIRRYRAGERVILPVIAYHGTGRLWAEHEEKKQKNRKKSSEGLEYAYQNCLSPKSSSKEFLKWYRNSYIDSLNPENVLDKLFIEVFNEAIVRILPQTTWDGLTYNMKHEDIQGFFHHSKSEIKQNEILFFSQLSDGYRNMIGMVADIAYRCIKLNPHLGKEVLQQTPGVVLIDELDLHLHPKWQRRIVADLKRTFPRIQFITTTHSPFIVQSLESNELINLDRDSDLKLNELTLQEIVTEVMGTESEMSVKYEENHAKSLTYLKSLESNPFDANQADLLENEIRDPAVKAFLQLQRIKKQNAV